MQHGALAARGSPRRYLLKYGVRYRHILDPRTGCPCSMTLARRDFLKLSRIAALYRYA
jgi:thiamine biosynthesis lipoprotein ApbE